MSTSIGDLSVGVSLDLSGMEAGLRKAKAQLKQLDKEYAAGPGARAMSSGGGFGTGYGARRNKPFSGGPLSLGERLGSKVGGDAIGRFVGGGRIGDMVMNGLGSTGGGIAAGAAGGVAFLSFAVKAANASKSLDSTTLAVQRFGENVGFLKNPLDSIKNVLGDIAVGAVGAANRIGEFIASGFNTNDSKAFDAAARGAAGQEAQKQRLAEAQGFKTWADYEAAVKGQRGANATFARDQAFAGTDDQGRARMLEGEIAKLRADQKTAAGERRTLDVEKIRAEIATKTADLTQLQKQIEQRGLDFNNATAMQRAGRMDAQDAQNAADTAAKIEGAVESFLSELNLDGARQIAALQTNATALSVNAGASSLGGTAGDGAAVPGLLRAQGRALEEMVSLLRTMAESAAFQRK